jgi:benzodiazapine receptor
MTRRPIWFPVLIAAVAASFVAALGVSATNIGPWYEALVKPSWQPPDWLFGPAWTLIYGLTALAGVIAWRAAATAALRRRIMVLFAVNGLLNVLWSELFFRFRRPDLALIEVAPFWLSIVVLIVALSPVSANAGRLLVPYALWVAFAGVLNLAIVRLNGPFAP